METKQVFALISDEPPTSKQFEEFQRHNIQVYSFLKETIKNKEIESRFIRTFDGVICQDASILLKYGKGQILGAFDENDKLQFWDYRDFLNRR